MTSRTLTIGAACCALLTILSIPTTVSAQDKARVIIPENATVIMPLDDVRIGMKGYGMTVFHGTDIEPFAVEVISVMRDFGPKQAVIWVRSDDPRMQLTGPVAGMSGSPIYLWDEAEGNELGQGGKLIGAFAFGYRGGKDCYVGVQAIEQMIAASDRADVDGERADQARAAPAQHVRATIDLLLAQARSRQLPEWRIRRLELMRHTIFGEDEAQGEIAARPVAALPAAIEGQSQAMLLPMTLGARRLAAPLSPVLAPMGLMPVAAPVGQPVGKPPHGIDADTIDIRPGSVLSIPFAWGDMDLSAAGTVTDVTPDGRVLAFGHAMDAIGDTAVPMASGFVHFIQPNIDTSFKLSGSGAMLGTIIRDEHSAVIGVEQARFKSAPAKITVNLPGQPRREYNYQMLEHPLMSPVIAAILAANSIAAEQESPLESTLTVSAELKFAGDRTLTFTRMLANGSAWDVLYELYAPIGLMTANGYEAMPLLEMNLTATIEDTLRMGTVVDARLERPEIAPGDEIGVVLSIQPYNAKSFTRRITLKTPDDLPEGDYELALTDGAGYPWLMTMSRPHLAHIESGDDIAEAINLMTDVRDDAMYMVLFLHEPGLAIGRNELPRLPGSQAALLTAPTSRRTMPFTETLERVMPMGMVINGGAGFVVTVTDHPGKTVDQ